jgi:hypothetical protein
MASVILYTDFLLREKSLSEKTLDRIRIIQNQGKNAAFLTQQVLDFSRKSIMDLTTFYVATMKQSYLLKITRISNSFIRGHSYNEL